MSEYAYKSHLLPEIPIYKENAHDEWGLMDDIETASELQKRGRERR